MIDAQCCVDALLECFAKGQKSGGFVWLLDIDLAFFPHFGVAAVHRQDVHVFCVREMQFQAVFISAYIGKIVSAYSNWSGINDFAAFYTDGNNP